MWNFAVQLRHAFISIPLRRSVCNRHAALCYCWHFYAIVSLTTSSFSAKWKKSLSPHFSVSRPAHGTRRDSRGDGGMSKTGCTRRASGKISYCIAIIQLHAKANPLCAFSHLCAMQVADKIDFPEWCSEMSASNLLFGCSRAASVCLSCGGDNSYYIRRYVVARATRNPCVEYNGLTLGANSMSVLRHV